MTMLAALAVLLLAACGGDDDSSSTTEAGAQITTKSDSGKKNGEGKSTSGGEAQSAGPKTSEFVPKHHTDSGGGSAQFEVKGGDNSVQEFGEEAGSSEFEAAAAVVHDFLDARAEGNWAAACTYMSKATIESFETIASRSKQGKDLSCGAILVGLINPAAKPDLKTEAEKADIRSLRVEGERAFVIYTGVDGTTIAMPMANEGGEWKVAALAGAPLG
jgi:hypothetical protein